MGDHTESFQVDFDPAVVGYEDLLELFWTSHDPTYRAWKSQYASLVLTDSDGQLKAAKESAERIARALGRAIETRIEALDRFWLAEDYHQKYYLRNNRTLMSEFEKFYPSDGDFLNSTAAARVNGYLHGDAGCLRLEQELPAFGLSDQADRYLRDVCRG